MTRSLLRTAFIALCCAPLVFAAGCGDEESDDNGGATTDTGGGGGGGADVGTGGGDDTGGGGGGECTDATPWHTDLTWRLTNVSIQKPAGRGALLEGLINTDIQEGELHVLIESRNFDSECGTANFELTGGAGAIVEGTETYTWFDGEEPEFKPATIDADGNFENQENLAIIFPALDPTNGEVIRLPVSELALSGVMAEIEGGQLVMVGDLTGVLLEEDVQDITIELFDGEQSIADLLGPDEKDWPEGAEVFTGWTLEATVEAVPVAPAE